MKVLVTGGAGFLGQALCKALQAEGHDVTSFQRSHSPALEAMGVRQVRGDLADAAAVLAAFEGQDAIFHNAAKAGAWGSEESYFSANVTGTRNVLAAMRAHGIGRLVYTSTPSVTHSGRTPVEGGNERDTIEGGPGDDSLLGGNGNRLDDRVTGRVEVKLTGSRLATGMAILALLLLAAIVGGWYLLADTGREALGPVAGWDPAALALGAVFVVLWGVLLLAMVLRMVRNAPWFVLTERGFFYAPGDIAPGFVRWEHVTELRETEIVATGRSGRAKATSVLAVGLRDPDRYFERYNPVLRALVRLGAKLHARQSGGAADILIDPTHFGERYPEIRARMQALHAQVTARNDGVAA